ncbi:MAG: pitrilysin family protein, partial [Gemmatimonadaceae bacterium]
RSKSQESLSLMLMMESAMGKAETLLGGQVLYHDPLQYIHDAQRSEAVKAEDVSRVLKRYLTPGRVVLSMVPAGRIALAADTSKPYTVAHATTAASQAASATGPSVSVPRAAADDNTRHTPETFDRSVMPKPAGSESIAFPAITVRTLSNGIRVAVLEDHRTPVVEVTAILDIPETADPEHKTGLSGIVSQLLGEETRTRTAQQIADTKALLGNYVSPTSSLVVTANVDSALALMADELRSPMFPETALKRTTANEVANLKNQMDDPQYLADRILNTELYGAAHPYARSASQGEIASISRSDVEQFYQEYYRPPNVQFVVAGDINPSQAVAKLQHYFGDWKSGRRARVTPPAPGAAPATTIYLYDRPGSAQSVILAGSAGPRRGTADQYAIELMNTVLGGAFNSRLNLDLRERRHLTYGASSSFDFRRPPEPGQFTAGAAVEAQKTDSAVAATVADLRGLLGADPITAKEFEFARSASIRRLPLQFETTLARAGAVNTMLGDSLSLRYYNDLVPNLQKVTLVQAAAAARKYLDMAHMAIVVVGDRKTVEPTLRALRLAPVVVVPPLQDLSDPGH